VNKLSLEEREGLLNIRDNNETKALFHLMDEIITAMGTRLLVRDLIPGEETKFAYEKCRIEGARQLQRDMKRYLEALSDSNE